MRGANSASDDRLPWIDALRGYAILGVVILHVGSMIPAAGPLTGWGQMGVELFFAVSAFTLAIGWEARPEPVWAFHLRRLFRIGPMFWVALVLYVTWSGLGYAVLGEVRTYRLWQIVMTAGLLQGLHPDVLNYVVPGDWSVSVEVGFYAVFPAIMGIVNSAARARTLLLLAEIVSIGALCVNFTTMSFAPRPVLQSLQQYWMFSMPVHFVAFAAGLLAFWIAKERPDQGSRPSAGVLLVLALVALVALSTCEVPSIPAFSLAFGVVIFCCTQGAGRWLAIAPVRHLGKISFSVYLLHFIFVDPVVRLLRLLELPGLCEFVLAVAVVLAISFCACTLTYEVVERPMIRLGRALVQRLQVAEAVAIRKPSL